MSCFNTKKKLPIEFQNFCKQTTHMTRMTNNVKPQCRTETPGGGVVHATPGFCPNFVQLLSKITSSRQQHHRQKTDNVTERVKKSKMLYDPHLRLSNSASKSSFIPETELTPCSLNNLRDDQNLLASTKHVQQDLVLQNGFSPVECQFRW